MSLDLTEGQIKVWQELKKKPVATLLDEYKTSPRLRAQVDELARNKDFAKWLSNSLLEHRKAVESGVQPTVAAATPEEQVPPVPESESTVPVVDTTPEPEVPPTDQLAAEATRLAAEEFAKQVAQTFSQGDKELAAIGIIVTRDVKGNVVKIVQDYQVTDAQGQPIGRRTHFESQSFAEHFGKLYDAHINAARALSVLKAQKLTFNPPKPVKLLAESEVVEIAAEIMAAKSPAEAAELISQIVDSKAEAHFKILNAKEAELKKTASSLAGLSARLEFVQRHLYDFNPCDANFKLLAQWVLERELQFTQDNLDLALVALQDTDTLAPYTGPSQTFAKVAANPAAAAPAAAVPAAQTIPVAATPVTETKPAAANPVTVESKVAETKPEVPAQQPVAKPAATAVEAPASTPVVANQPSTTRRPGVDGSLQPGSLSAQRVTSKAVTFTLQDFLRMSSQEIRERKKDPKFRAQMEALGIKDVAATSKATGATASARNNDAW